MPIKDFLQNMSKNTYHFYKCEFCKQNCQKNFTQIFKYCFHCKKILCSKCLLKHKSYINHRGIQIYVQQEQARHKHHKK